MATKSWKEEITDELLSFATENQAARLAVILECGSLAEAARRIGIHERSLYKIVSAVKNKAAKIALANLLDFVEEDKQGDNHETK